LDGEIALKHRKLRGLQRKHLEGFRRPGEELSIDVLGLRILKSIATT